jgi:adenosylcobalamin-dependent ribonucleoside-triphosphate reductase
MCVKLGVRFSESHKNSYISYILSSIRYAIEKEAQAYCHKLRIPVPVKLTTVAPTGTIAKMPGTTEGLHPIHSKYFIRRIRFSTIKPEEVEQFEALKAQGYKYEDDISAPNTVIIEIPTMEKLVQEVIDLGYDPEIVESADEISLDDMFAVQAFIQRVWADNAVSFTANVEVGKYSPDDLAALLEKWLPNLKGTTIFPDVSRPQSPYERISREEYEALTGPKDIADSIDEECASGACPIR